MSRESNQNRHPINVKIEMLHQETEVQVYSPRRDRTVVVHVPAGPDLVNDPVVVNVQDD